MLVLDQRIRDLKSEIIELKTLANKLPSPLKRCKQCGQEKPYDKFTTSIVAKDGHVNICKKCISTNRKALAIAKKYGAQ